MSPTPCRHLMVARMNTEVVACHGASHVQSAPLQCAPPAYHFSGQIERMVREWQGADVSEFERLLYKKVGNAYDKSGRQIGRPRTSRRGEASAWL